MTWVKLCGMTRRRDVEVAVAAGADAVGFVVYDGSPRRVAPARVAHLASDLPIASFLVTVDAEPGWLVDTARGAGTTGVQPHGRHASEAAGAALAAGLEVLYPVAVGAEKPDLSVLPPGARLLLDSAAAGLYGGTGRPFDWSLVAGLDPEFVLAGGLTPDTVAEAVRRARPWGVDVASGVEEAPGIKDHRLLRRFVEEAKK